MFKQLPTTIFKKGMTPQKRMYGSLMTPNELKSAMGTVKILDGSWHMPNAHRDPYKEYLEKRIPGSQFFGIDTIKDTSVDLPHMLPPPAVFAEAIGNMGISQDDHVVVYDTAGVFSACRVYWTFKAFGHDTVSVLNGGLPLWEKIGGSIERGKPSAVEPKHYLVPKINKNLVRDYQTVLATGRAVLQEELTTTMNYKDGMRAQILDARPYPRFTGEAPEPREGLSSGHMPGSISIPFNEVINTATGEMLDNDQLLQAFEGKGVDLSKEIITSCGSGITASILYLALERIGAKHLAVYDGSWTEYASKEDAIIIKD